MMMSHGWKDMRGLCPCVPFKLHSTTSCESSSTTIASPEPFHGHSDTNMAMTDDLPTAWPHQVVSLKWMRHIESERHRLLEYAGNMQLCSGWCVDAENECMTQDLSMRHAVVRGGYLSDWPGAGKTATTLIHCAQSSSSSSSVPPASRAEHTPTIRATTVQTRASLIIVPLNLCAHWMQEAKTFIPHAHVVCLWNKAHFQSHTLQSLMDATVVITTFEFLLDSRSYRDMVEATLTSDLELASGTVSARGNRAFTRAALVAWARHVATLDGRRVAPPVVEALHRHRVIVDETRCVSYVPSRKVPVWAGDDVLLGHHRNSVHVPGQQQDDASLVARGDRAYHRTSSTRWSPSTRLVSAPESMQYAHALRPWTPLRKSWPSKTRRPWNAWCNPHARAPHGRRVQRGSTSAPADVHRESAPNVRRGSFRRNRRWDPRRIPNARRVTWRS